MHLRIAMRLCVAYDPRGQIVSQRNSEVLPCSMAKFVTIGYGDQEGYNRASKDVRDAAHSHDAKLVGSGALTGIAGSPVQVRTLKGGLCRQPQEPT